MTGLLVATILLAAAAWWALWWPRKEPQRAVTVNFTFSVDAIRYAEVMRRHIAAYSQLGMSAQQAAASMRRLGAAFTGDASLPLSPDAYRWTPDLETT